MENKFKAICVPKQRSKEMEINRLIDHTLLKADAVAKDIDKLCDEAKQYNFRAVCVNSSWVEHCVKQLQGSTTDVCCVIGFPLGACLTEAKVAEANAAIEKGVKEIDMVINIAYLKDGRYTELIDDIRHVKNTCGAITLKVIIETCLLTDDEKKIATQAVIDAGADFVKTSTGFSTAGATVADVLLMKSITHNQIKIKAAGGVKTVEDLYAMVEAGASRIGTSRGVSLMQGVSDSSNSY